MLNTEKFTELYAGKVGLTKKEGREQVDTFLETVLDAVKAHGGVDFYQHWGIEVNDTEARTVKNPQFGKNPEAKEYVDVPAGKKTKLKRNKLLKEATK